MDREVHTPSPEADETEAREWVTPDEEVIPEESQQDETAENEDSRRNME